MKILAALWQWLVTYFTSEGDLLTRYQLAAERRISIEVWEINDTEWWAGTDLDSIKKAYSEITGLDPDDEDEGFQDPHKLTELHMEKIMFTDEDGSKRSFREQLDIMIKDGKQKFPYMFATTEY